MESNWKKIECKNNSNKGSSITRFLAFLTLITILFSVFPLTTVAASTVDTYAFLTVAPNPTGVGQQVLVTMWLNLVPPTAGIVGFGDRWENFEITIVTPNGDEEVLGPFSSDAAGLSWTLYVPDSVGTYTFEFSFPGQEISFLETTYYNPSTSQKVELIVQEDPIEAYPDYPLPDGYWDRPIDAQNRNWWQISGNWLERYYNATGPFNPYTEAPNTAHIVWTKELSFGGLIGGDYETTAYYNGLTYEHKFLPPIIMNGILYYNNPDPPKYGFCAVDIRTGEEIWWQNSTSTSDVMNAFGYGGIGTYQYPALTLGQIYDYNSPSQHGGIPYLWSMEGPTWSMFDAFTGNWILDIANATTGTTVMSPAGDILVYVLDGTNNWLAMWNSSKCIGPAGPDAVSTWMWRPQLGETLDWNDGIQWNVTVPDVTGAQYIQGITSGVIVATTASIIFGNEEITEIGYSAETGEQLWAKTIVPTVIETSFNRYGPMSNGIYTTYDKTLLQWYAYDVFTGNELWGPSEPHENSWAMYGETSLSKIAYDKLYATFYDGRVTCFDINDGTKLWTFYTGSSGAETVYGHYPLYNYPGMNAIADEKLYVATGEHSPSQPLWRGSELYCIDTETGESLWSILGWFQSGLAIADGYLLGHNCYDNEIYCFGKGQTQTTIAAGPKVVSTGSSTLIEGTVTDQSPGAKGTPAISDEDMSEWMEYLYMQKPCPVDVDGVEVVISTLDPNGNIYEIGTVRSDSNGMFKLLWEPPVSGEYTIIANFAGSESYWSSSAQTALGVTEANSPNAPIENQEPVNSDDQNGSFTSSEIVIIATVAIAAIICLVAYLVIKRK